MLRTRFQEQLKQSMHARDQIATSTLRLIIAAMQDRDIAARGKGNWDGISEDEILLMLRSMVKQRLESIKMYEIGKRMDLVEREKAEVRIIETFLPKQMDDAQIKTIIEEVVTSVQATGLKDMGKVMAEMKVKYPGQLDFSKASGMVKSRLGG